MQFRRAANHATLQVGDDDGTIVSAFAGVALNEAVIHEAVEAVMAALRVEPQQVIAQQRQLVLPAQRPNDAPGRRRTGSLLIVHHKSSRKALEEASNP